MIGFPLFAFNALTVKVLIYNLLLNDSESDFDKTFCISKLKTVWNEIEEYLEESPLVSLNLSENEGLALVKLHQEFNSFLLSLEQQDLKSLSYDFKHVKLRNL